MLWFKSSSGRAAAYWMLFSALAMVLALVLVHVPGTPGFSAAAFIACPVDEA